jgi:hypothetical protein
MEAAKHQEQFYAANKEASSESVSFAQTFYFDGYSESPGYTEPSG